MRGTLRGFLSFSIGFGVALELDSFSPASELFVEVFIQFLQLGASFFGPGHFLLELHCLSLQLFLLLFEGVEHAGVVLPCSVHE